MLPRVAHEVYRSARDVERSLLVARVLEVSSAQALEGALSNGAGGRLMWEPALAVAADPDHFHRRHLRAEWRSVSWYLSLSDVNPDGVAVCIARARERLRGVRAWLPSELFEAMSSADLAVRAWTPERLNREGVYAFCHEVGDAVARIDGVVDRCVRRDELWQLLRLGRNLERAQQTARVVCAHESATEPVGMGDWRTMLKVTSAYECYLRVAMAGDVDASAFVLCDPMLPASVTTCLAEVASALDALRAQLGAEGVAASRSAGMGAFRAAAGAARSGASRTDVARLSQRLDLLDGAVGALFASGKESYDGALHAQAVRQAQN